MFEFVAKPDRTRLALLFLGSVVFVVLGAVFAGLFGARPTDTPLWVGWASIVFFGPCAVAWGARLFDRRDVLRIGAPGIWSLAHGEVVIPWTEIRAVGVWGHARARMLVLSLEHPERYPATGLARRLAAPNRALTGADTWLSLVGTDRTLDEALGAIDKFRPA